MTELWCEPSTNIGPLRPQSGVDASPTSIEPVLTYQTPRMSTARTLFGEASILYVVYQHPTLGEVVVPFSVGFD